MFSAEAQQELLQRGRWLHTGAPIYVWNADIDQPISNLKSAYRRAVLNSVTNRECTFRVVTSRVYGAGTAEIQFKNAIMMLAAQAAVLVPDDPQWAVEIFSEILRAISRVKYCRPKPSRPAQPSPESPSPPNKWCSGKRKKLEEA